MEKPRFTPPRIAITEVLIESGIAASPTTESLSLEAITGYGDPITEQEW